MSDILGYLSSYLDALSSNFSQSYQGNRDGAGRGDLTLSLAILFAFRKVSQTLCKGGAVGSLSKGGFLLLRQLRLLQ